MEYGIKRTSWPLTRWELLYRHSENVPWSFYGYTITRWGAEKEIRNRIKDEEVIVIS